MYALKQFGSGEYYFKIPGEWMDQRGCWEELGSILEPVLSADTTIYLDLEEIADLPSEIFNILFDLAAKAGKVKAGLNFTGVAQAIEERISLLVNASE
jgi:hypothetical protein